MTDDKPIRIVRVPHSKDRPYFSMARATAQDTALSYEALGMLTYLLSKSDSWEVNIKDISKRSTRYKAYKILRELRQAGYMKLEKEKGDGRFSKWVYQIFETSQLIEFQQVENQVVENQHTKRVQSKPESIDPEPITSTDVKVPKSELDAQYDAIAEVWDTKANGTIVCMRGMIFGSTKTRGQWKMCQFEPPATVDELKKFAPYMETRMKDKNLTDKPTTPVVVQRWFYDFREAALKATQPRSWSDIPELAGIKEIIT